MIDCSSRRCVGWSMRDDLRSEIVLDALGIVVTRRRPKAGVIYHSDRGSRYTSLAATFRSSLRSTRPEQVLGVSGASPYSQLSLKLTSSSSSRCCRTRF